MKCKHRAHKPCVRIFPPTFLSPFSLGVCVVCMRTTQGLVLWLLAYFFFSLSLSRQCQANNTVIVEMRCCRCLFLVLNACAGLFLPLILFFYSLVLTCAHTPKKRKEGEKGQACEMRCWSVSNHIFHNDTRTALYLFSIFRLRVPLRHERENKTNGPIA